MSDFLRELLAVFDIRVDSGPLKAADKEISGLKGTIKSAATAIAGYFAIDTFAGFLKDSIELGASLDDTAQRLGVNVEQLQAFQYAAGMSGASVEDANAGLKFFTKNLGDAATAGGDAAATFAKLGVSISDGAGGTRDSLDLLGDVAEGFSKLKTQGEKTQLAMQLFGRGGTALIPLLNQGRAGVAQLTAEFKKMGGAIDESTIKALADADDELDKLSFATKGLRAQLVASVVPALKEMVSVVTSGVGAFREWTAQSHIVEAVMITLTAAAGMAAIAWAVLNFEILLVVLALALIALAIDDLWTFFDGGDSLLGRMLGEEKSEQVRAFFADLKVTLGELADKAGELWDVAQEKWPEVKASLVSAEESITKAVNAAIALANVFSGLVDWSAAFTAGLSGAALVISAIAKWAELTAQQVKIAADAAALIYGHGGGQVSTVASLLTGGGGGTNNTQNSQANDVKITINGVAQEAASIGKAAGDAVTGSLLGLRSAWAGVSGGG